MLTALPEMADIHVLPLLLFILKYLEKSTALQTFYELCWLTLAANRGVNVEQDW